MFLWDEHSLTYIKLSTPLQGGNYGTGRSRGRWGHRNNHDRERLAIRLLSSSALRISAFP
jgi:hypothetical protein